LGVHGIRGSSITRGKNAGAIQLPVISLDLPGGHDGLHHEGGLLQTRIQRVTILRVGVWIVGKYEWAERLLSKVSGGRTESADQVGRAPLNCHLIDVEELPIWLNRCIVGTTVVPIDLGSDALLGDPGESDVLRLLTEEHRDDGADRYSYRLSLRRGHR
jgi:hypothetical protein